MSSAGSVATWGPSLVGCALVTMLTGVSLGQGYAYFQWFHKERRLLKILVLSILFVDIVQTAMTLGVAWMQFISCRRNILSRCIVENNWPSLVALPAATLTTFGVQVFYSYRVWIVSANNWVVTGSVAILAVVQLVLGAPSCAIESLEAIPSPYLPASFGISAVCDVIISASMVFYLREARTGVRRSGNRLQRLMVVFVQMGLITCLTAILVALSFAVQGAPWQALPSLVLPKLYVNSMFAVLNARKTIRENARDAFSPEIIIPTIRTSLPP